MTSTNWDVAQDIGLINHDIGFNIACVFYFATADGKESDMLALSWQFYIQYTCFIPQIVVITSVLLPI